MLTTKYLLASAGIGAVGAAALLAAQYTSSVATPESTTARDVRLAAQPLTLSQMFPWAAGPSTGAATVSALVGPTAAAASGALATVNQFGPVGFNLDSLRSIGIQQSVPGTNNTLGNVTSVDQWLLGVTGLASSTGAIGFTQGAAQYDPFMANHAGFLQTNNVFGPAVFDLNVLKAIGFFQAPTGSLLASGYPDNVSAVDIGRWRAGIPGVIMNTGTTGFVDYADMGPGPIQASASGGLQTALQIGSGPAFGINVLPRIGAGIMPYGVSFTMAPYLTAADTPFAPATPPPPGVIAPPLFNPPQLPAPAPAPAPAPRIAAATVVEPEADSVVETSRVSQAKPKQVIPGVNGAPLSTPPKTGSTGASGGSAYDPFTPLKPLADAIKGGFGSMTGASPSAGGASTGGAGDGSASAGGGAAGE